MALGNGSCAWAESSMSGSSWRLAGMAGAQRRAMPGGQVEAERSRVVGSPEPAPPQRWTSAYMLAPRNAADSMESPPEAGAQAASVVAALAATWRSRDPAGRARTAGKSRPA